jgi:hypothetical protein
VDIATGFARGVLARLAAPRLALRQLAWALRSRADVEPCGVAITRILLTEPSSPLSRPAYRDELYERARAALFALGSCEASSATRWRP